MLGFSVGKQGSPFLGLSIMLCSSALFPAMAGDAPAGERGKPLAMLLGDSIRMGYQKEVERNLAGKVEVWSPEENCEDTTFSLPRLEKWLAGRKAAVIHVNWGLHDIFLNEKEEPRRSVEAYAANLRKLFAKIKELDKDAVLVFALTTPVDEARQRTSKTYGRLVRRNSDVDAINAKAKEIAAEFGARIDDLHAPVAEEGVEVMLVDDGIHLNPKAASVLGAKVAKSVEDALAKKKSEAK